MQRIDRRPLYLQVHDVLVDRIARGHWRLGEPLPAEGSLAEELGVSVGTLRKALELLEASHVITRQQGRGTFVADYANSNTVLRFNPLRSPDGSPLHGHAETLGHACHPATVEEAARLGIGVGDAVLRCRAIRSRDGVTFMLEQTVAPAAKFPNGKDVSSVCELFGLAQTHGIVVGRIVERVRAVATPPEVAEAMRTTAGAPILEIDRTTHDVNGDIIEWRVSWCDPGDGWYAQER